MDSLLLITILIVILALAFDFINGFHDTANAIATAVSTKALRPRVAIVLAASMNFLGAMTFTGVAQTITKDIVSPFQFAKWFNRDHGSPDFGHSLELDHLVFWHSKQFFACADRIDCGRGDCICRNGID